MMITKQKHQSLNDYYNDMYNLRHKRITGDLQVERDGRDSVIKNIVG